jgi:hypothetical protein
MTVREELQEKLQRRIASYDETMLSHLALQMDALEAENRELTKDFTDMVAAIKEGNKNEDPDELQQKIDEALEAVRYP